MMKLTMITSCTPLLPMRVRSLGLRSALHGIDCILSVGDSVVFACAWNMHDHGSTNASCRDASEPDGNLHLRKGPLGAICVQRSRWEVLSQAQYTRILMSLTRPCNVIWPGSAVCRHHPLSFDAMQRKGRTAKRCQRQSKAQRAGHRKAPSVKPAAPQARRRPVVHRNGRNLPPAAQTTSLHHLPRSVPSDLLVSGHQLSFDEARSVCWTACTEMPSAFTLLLSWYIHGMLSHK